MNVYSLDAAAIVVSLVCIRSWLAWRRRRSSAFPLPPGPKGLPFIGNALDMPGKDEWEAARKWGEKYGKGPVQDICANAIEYSRSPPGDLVYIENFGTRFLFVNSYEVAVELFEKRGNMYSSRPTVPMIDLCEFHDFLTHESSDVAV